ncbi:MAG: hypothetical protein OCD01_07725 [Fibrobacterales bacterium]
MLIKCLILVLTCTMTIAFAEQSDSLTADTLMQPLGAPQAQAMPELKNEATTDTTINIMEEFEIFGDDNQSSIFILGFDNSELDKEIQEQIMLRSFSKDLYFMQNIDREEFESQRNLRSNIYSEFNHSDFDIPDEGSEKPSVVE